MGAGGVEIKGTAPPRTNLRGRDAQIWSNGSMIGVLFRWQLRGSKADWEGEAERYALPVGFPGGEVEFRFVLKFHGEPVLELRGSGHLLEPFIADSQTHRERVCMKGTQLEVA
jgi:hypothetical protein